jgi:hypothetical protein
LEVVVLDVGNQVVIIMEVVVLAPVVFVQDLSPQLPEQILLLLEPLHLLQHHILEQLEIHHLHWELPRKVEVLVVDIIKLQQIYLMVVLVVAHHIMIQALLDLVVE